VGSKKNKKNLKTNQNKKGDYNNNNNKKYLKTSKNTQKLQKNTTFALHQLIKKFHQRVAP